MDELLMSLLTPEQQAMAQQRAQQQGLMSLGFGLLGASQGQRGQPRPGFGQIISQAGPQAMQAYQGSFDRTLRDIMVGQQLQEADRRRKQEAAQQKAIDAYISGLPEDQQKRFRAFPTQATEAMFAEQPEQFVQLTPAQAAERGLPTDKVFQASTKTGKISQVGGGGQTIQNIIGGGELTPGQKKVDEKFAEDFVAWSSGGGQDMAAQIAQLKPVISALEEGKPITGLQVAVQPDLLLAMTNPTALQSREQVEEVVQRNLRVILGAQFTEKEGERLIARAFNPKLPPQENAKRLRRLFLQMSTAAEQKQAMGDYFQENGTLRGYKGKMPTVNDFYNAMEGSAPTFSGDSAQSLQNQARRILEQRQGER
jgi:hypothetical protein